MQANTTEQGHATTDHAGEKEIQEEAPDSTKQVTGFVSAGSGFDDSAVTTKMLKGTLTAQNMEADGAAVAVAVAEGVEEKSNHHEADKIETEHGKSPISATALGAAIAALGIYNGTQEFAEARKKGDVAGQVVSGADLTVGVTSLGVNVAELTGWSVPEMLENTTRIGGTAVLVAGSTIKVLNAKPEDRAAVATGEVVKDGVGLGVAAAGEGIATGLGLTGAAAGALPAVLAAGAVYGVDKGVEKVMDDRKDYQNWEKDVDAEKNPVKDTPAAGKVPDPADYRHLMAAMRESSDNIKYEQIQNTPVKRGPITIHLGADGRPGPGQQQIDGLNRVDRELDKTHISREGFEYKSTRDAGFLLKVDLTNPRNLKEMGNAIDVEIAMQQKIMQDNESSVAAYLRTSTGALKGLTATGGWSAQHYMEAKEKLVWLQSGRAELTQYEKDLKTYNDSRAMLAQAPQIPSARDSFQKASASNQTPAGPQPSPQQPSPDPGPSASPAPAALQQQPAVQSPPLTGQAGKEEAAGENPGPAPAVQTQEAPSPASTQGEQNSDTPGQKKDDDIVTSGGIKADGVDCRGDFEVAAKGQTQAPAPAPAAVLAANNARPTQQNNSPSV